MRPIVLLIAIIATLMLGPPAQANKVFYNADNTERIQIVQDFGAASSMLANPNFLVNNAQPMLARNSAANTLGPPASANLLLSFSYFDRSNIAAGANRLDAIPAAPGRAILQTFRASTGSNYACWMLAPPAHNPVMNGGPANENR